MSVISPNVNIRPLTCTVNPAGHLCVGGCDTVDLVRQFGSPLWVIDQATVEAAARAVKAGLSGYPDARVLYAGKAFLCLAMCHLVRSLDMGLDVVSEGELYTALQSGFPAELIFAHGNNKSAAEISAALASGDVKFVVDNAGELDMLARLAAARERRARVLLRVTPGVEPDTHHYIKTGQNDSKFGIPLSQLGEVASTCLRHGQSIELLGLHAHIGSQAKEIDPYIEIVDILADCFADLKATLGIQLGHLDLGGGLGIKYTDEDSPVALFDWSAALSDQVARSFTARRLPLPRLYLEPGRAIIGTAGLTLYTAGHGKRLPGGSHYLALDGGMADNPRPVTYQARYTAANASRMEAPVPDEPLTLVGKYCESGDIIVKDAYLHAESGDIIAVFGTGAYNYSMASNYNRTGRPACVLVMDGEAEVIIGRESNADLTRHDLVPDRLRQS